MKTWAEVADELGADKTAMAKWVWAREATDEITRLREQVRVLREALADAHVFMQIMMEEHGDHGVRLLIKDTEAALEATKP